MDKEKEYVKVEGSFFLEGMYVESEVYFLLRGRRILLCKNTIITSDMLRRLEAFEGYNGILYVELSNVASIQEQYEYFSRNSSFVPEEYSELKDDVRNAFQEAYESGEIILEESKKTVTHVQKMIEIVDSSLLLQCASVMRDISEYLYAHSLNVAMINGLFSKWLGMDKEDQARMITIGLLHDLGKVRIPPSILEKPEQLTREEFIIIQLHPGYSCEILREAGVEDQEILAAVRGHHEKMNGSGYPDGLTGNQIPLFAKITAIADIYDAMIARRAYKEPVSPFEVLDSFSKDKYSDLDISLVNLFVNRMAMELVGKKVLLNNGKIGIVVYVNQNSLAYPIIEINGNMIQLSGNIKCVSLCQ